MSISERFNRQEQHEVEQSRRVQNAVYMVMAVILGGALYLTVPTVLSTKKDYQYSKQWREDSSHYALRLIYMAQLEFLKWGFAKEDGKPRYAKEVSELTEQGLMDVEFLRLRKKCYYNFEIKLCQRLDGNAGFEAIAIPFSEEKLKSFYIDESGVLRYSTQGRPTHESPIAQPGN